MADADDKSRYRDAGRYAVVDRRGRTVNVVAAPAPPREPVAGWHTMSQGQRLDHVAWKYLDDAAGFWRVAEANEAMNAEWLSEAGEVAVPAKRG